MRVRAGDPRRLGWWPPETRLIPDWLRVFEAGDGWWQLVPIWEPAQAATPLRRWEPPVPYWARDP
jgi:hypothetical protein